jgi:hypothetical protein
MRSAAEIIKKWYEDAWVKGNWDTPDSLYRPVSQDTCLVPDALLPLEEARELSSIMNTLVKSQKINVIHTVQEGPWISAIVEMHAENAATDEPVHMRWTAFLRIEDDRVVETYPAFDFLKYFEQLGLLPQNSFELLLSGTALR